MKKRLPFIVVLLFALLFLFAHSSHAIYKWEDEKGVIHFSDNPKPTKAPAKESEDEKQEKIPSSNQDEKKPIVAPSTRQPDAQQKAVFPTQAPTSTPTVPQMPVQPSSKNTLTSPVPMVQPRPMAPPQTGQGVPRPGLPRALSPHDKQAAELQAALMAEYMPMILLIGVAFYVYYCLCTYLIAKKLDVPAAWLAWIPILQIWVIFRSAGKSLWWILLLLVPILGLVVSIYLWMCIAENLGKNKWLGLLTLVPIVGLVVYLGVLAFSSKEA